jgi:branched-subunit amino acid ABC-type transport system permease component
VLYLQYLIFGLVTGCILLMGSVGFSMIQRLDNFMNMTHGMMIALAAFLAWFLFTTVKLPLLAAAAIVIVFIAVFTWAQYKVVFAPVRKAGTTMLLFTSVGLSFMINGAMEGIFGATPKSINYGTPRQFYIGDQPIISSTDIIIIVLAVISGVGLHLFLTRTRLGIAVRAMSSQFDLARVRGVNTEQVAAAVWAIAGALAAVAGVLYGLKGTVYTDMGWTIILLVLSAATVGGMGSVYGVMIGSLLIGVIMDMSVLWINPAYRSAMAFVVIIIMLIVRPQGIFGGGRARG